MYFYLMVGRISMICQDSDESGRRACQIMKNKKKARGSGEEGEGAGRRYRPPKQYYNDQEFVQPAQRRAQRWMKDSEQTPKLMLLACITRR